jgi:aspartate dehydrogenase
VFDSEKKKCDSLLKEVRNKPKAVKGPDAMEGADLVIEAASQDAVREYATGILDRSDIMIMSVGALADDKLWKDLLKKAEANGHRIYVPSGSIAGLDAVKSAAAGKIEEVTITTRKPPKALADSNWVREKDISMATIKKPTVIFEGSAREAARWFPKNVNVSVSLSLAGIGPEKTKVRVMADPFSDRNVHEIEVKGSFGRMTTVTENRPSPKNPRTSRLAALSAVATLKKIRGNAFIGT